MRNQDTFLGCLLGGASGDALGYAIEFLDEDRIFRLHGPGGIRQLEMNQQGVAEISDDTQMTLFTACGLLHARACLLDGPEADLPAYTGGIRRSYLDWYQTQTSDYPGPGSHAGVSWLYRCPGMFSTRAPGTTCMSALREGGLGTPDEPLNSSKGCGGIMRVAPIGLFFCDCDVPEDFVPRLGAAAAALTHGHPLGWLPAAVLTAAIRDIAQQGTPIHTAICRALDLIDDIWPENQERLYMRHLTEQALDLAQSSRSDLDAIHLLGAGWVAEETLAIGVYCAAKYSSDFASAMVAAVNHRGDSDSTGSVAGNLLGASLGLKGIPEAYLENLELRKEITQTAEDLLHGMDMQPEMRQRYTPEI